jgi:hypothetical protein
VFGQPNNKKQKKASEMKTAFKLLTIVSLAIVIQPGRAQGEMGPMQCGTKMSKTTEASCVASGCDSCEQQSATEYLFCTDTTDNVACWRTPCERFTATYQRRTGECDGDCVCQFGEWVDVTTTFDHTNTTDECGT